METISLIIALVSVIVAVVSVVFSVITYNRTVKHDRKQATLEAYNRLQSEVFDNLNRYTPAQIRNICEEPTSPEYKTISGYLARIEHFCVGVNERIYDEDIFYVMAHGYFDGYQLKKRIEPLLEAKNKSNNTQQLYYVNILAVLDWMKKRNNKS